MSYLLERLAMDSCMLPKIKRCQMKAEGAYPSQYRIQHQLSQTCPLVLVQALVYQIQIREEIIGRSVGPMVPIARVPQPHDHKAEEPAIEFCARDACHARRFVAHVGGVFAQLLVKSVRHLYLSAGGTQLLGS